MKSVSESILFLLLFNPFFQVALSDISDISEKFGRKNAGVPREGDDSMFREIEEEMLLLNKSGYVSRDKRALGILLQGFMEALGYTVSPIQLGSLPNPSAAAATPAGGAAAAPPAGGMMPPAPPAAGGMQATLFQQQPGAGMMPPAPPAGMMNASASTPARQRETIRFTGLLNFGNSDNSSHLINHLSRYEQMFHGNRTAAPTAAAMPAPAPMPPPMPATASGPDIDPRSRPPLKEPLFVQIPLPIVPNLPPPQPPSPMPLDHSYDGGSSYSKDSSEEYSSSKDDEGQSGHFNEEDENSHDSDDFDYKYDKYDRTYENKDPDESYEEPKSNDKHAETEYNESDERPAPKDKHTEKEYNDDDERRKPTEKHTEKEYIDNDERPKPKEKHTEKEYIDRDEPPKPKEKHVEKEYKTNKNVENFTVENKEIYDPREVDEEGPPGGSQFNHATFVDEPDWKEKQENEAYRIAAEQEARAEALAEENAEREKQRERDHNEEAEFHRNREKEIDDANEERDESYQKKPYYDDEEEEGSSEKEHYDEERKYHEDDEKEADHEEKGTQRTEARAQLPTTVAQPKNYNQDADFYPATLPISYDRDHPPKDKKLRDSYGKSLENPAGKVDERVSEYITMFKNPKTGVYDPTRAREYEHARISFDHSDLIDGFNRIQKEYGAPENKYEEYEIDGGDRVEHRSNNKHGDESKESLATHEPTECSCHKKKKVQLEMQAALSTERSVTQPPPVISSTQPEPNYGPYYSTMKYLYDPLERDHGIIARLTSYEKPTTVRFENHADVLANHTTLSPTIPPERLTTLSFLREAENKEIRAWPAPFDYVYDNSEPKSVVYKKSPTTASMPAPFKPTKPSCNHHMIPFAVHKDKIKLPIRDGSGERFKSDRSLKKPNNFHENRKAKPSEQINKRVEYYTTHPATQPTVFDHRKRPSSAERFSNYRVSTKPPTRAPTLADIITARPERARSTKNPRKNRKVAKHVEQTVRPTTANIGESTILPTIQVKYTYPYGQEQLGNVRQETTNYVKKGGMLMTIPEPAPYHYNQFTEEPQKINTDGVQFQEYRNLAGTINLAELKQLQPEGPMEFFKYTRNL